MKNKCWLVVLLLLALAIRYFPINEKAGGRLLKTIPYETVINYRDKANEQIQQKAREQTRLFRIEIQNDDLSLYDYHENDNFYKTITVENISSYKNSFDDNPYARPSEGGRYLSLISRKNDIAILIKLKGNEIIVLPFACSYLEWNYNDTYCILSRSENNKQKQYLFEPVTQKLTPLEPKLYGNFQFSDAGKYVYDKNSGKALQLLNLETFSWEEIELGSEPESLKWSDKDKSMYIISKYVDETINLRSLFTMGGLRITWHVMKITNKNGKHNVQKIAISRSQTASNFVWSDDFQSVFYTNITAEGYSGFELVHGFN